MSQLEPKKTAILRTRWLREILLQPKYKDAYTYAFDILVEGNYLGVFEIMHRAVTLGSPDIIPIVQALVLAREGEFEYILGRLRKEVPKQSGSSPHTAYLRACLMGVIKSVGILNSDLSQTIPDEKAFDECFVNFLLWVLESDRGGRGSYETQISDTLAVFIGSSPNRIDPAWRQLTKLVQRLVGEYRPPATESFQQIFLDNLTHKLWVRVSNRKRLEVLSMPVMETGVC